MQPDDEFLVGTSVSADSGYWVSYYAYQNAGTPRNPPLITQSIYLPHGQSGVGATTNSGIDPTSWTTTQRRCLAGITCYEAGDFHTVASNPFAAATTPFIRTGIGRKNDIFQSFVQDPPGAPNVPNFKPNFVPIPQGAHVANLATPVQPGAVGLPPGAKLGLRRTP